MFRRGLAALIVIMFCAGTGSAQDGKLDRIRNEVNPPSPLGSPKPSDNSGSPSQWDDDDDEGIVSEIVGGLLSAILSGDAQPHDPNDPVAWYLRNPYAGNQDGYMRFMNHKERDDLIQSAPPRKCIPQSWSFRFAVDDAYNFDGVNQLQGQLWIEGQSGLGFYTSWNWLHEELSCGCKDDMVLGKMLMTARVPAFETWLLRWGIGANVLGDHGHTDWGMNFMLEADVFPHKPWIISAQIDGGWVGDAGLVHGRLTAGVIYRHCEAYLGFDYLRIGSVDIYGPVGGVRFWY